MKPIKPAKEIEGWSSLYQFRKDNGRLTGPGRYEDVFKLGTNRYVLSAYHGLPGKDDWMEGTAEEVLSRVAVR